MKIPLTWDEQKWLFLLIILIVTQLWTGLKSREKTLLWSPLTVISLTYIYYGIIGPLLALNTPEGTIVKTIEHRPYLETAWKGASISLLFIFIGYYFSNLKSFKFFPILNSDQVLIKKSQKVFFLAFTLLLISAGFGVFTKINFLDSGVSSGYSGSLSGYLMQSVIFFIAPVLLMLKPFLSQQKKWLFWFYVIIAVSIFINEAFRYRLVVLLLSVSLAYHIYLDKIINLKLALTVIIPFLMLMGILEVARTYGKGIDLERASQYSSGEFVSKSFNESAVFLATGYMIENYTNDFEHSKFSLITNTLAMPIPRQLWSSKPAGEYLLTPLDKYYGRYGKGQAILNYGEYYMAWGWWGIVIFSFVIGVFCKFLVNWIRIRQDNYLAIVMYSFVSAMMYVLISRGYLAQYVTLVIFALIPMLLVKPKYNIDIE